MIAAAMERLAIASQIPLPIPRMQAYGAAVAGLGSADKSNLIAVLTEGALNGPDAARGLARSLGG